MDRQHMVDQLQHEQKQLLFWMGQAQGQGMAASSWRMSWALSLVADLLRTLRKQPVTPLEFLQACDESSSAVIAYREALQEREYKDRIWSLYMQTREWVHTMQRKGLVERDSEGNYYLTQKGKDYFNAEAA